VAETRSALARNRRKFTDGDFPSILAAKLSTPLLSEMAMRRRQVAFRIPCDRRRADRASFPIRILALSPRRRGLVQCRPRRRSSPCLRLLITARIVKGTRRKKE